jgi:hypothetical protein
MEGLPMMIDAARNMLTGPETFASDPTLTDVPVSMIDVLSRLGDRIDFRAEMGGLNWSTGIVDLRCLLAFQRRLVFDDRFLHPKPPAQDDWPALAALAFGPPVPFTYRTVVSTESLLVLQSENPNLRICMGTACDGPQLLLQGGSPFFEVAEFGGRWFLRDGYHRAYRLLRAGIMLFPAVLVRARSLTELGPVQPWFFPEETLFASRPPRVLDFLDDDLTIEYTRPRLLKTLRVTIEESVELAQPHSLQENQNEQHFNHTR